MRAELVDGRRAERHDAADEVGPADGEHAGEDPAAALADDRDALPALRRELLEPLLEPLQVVLASSRRWRGCRRGGCGSRSRAASGSSCASEPSPAMKPGDQQDRAPVAVGHAAAAPHRAARTARAASTPAQALAPERGEVRKRDAHVHFVPHLATRRPRPNGEYPRRHACRHHRRRPDRGRRPP